ncbi:MAG: hypothetical protein LQ337_002398 [Flavoplaca oasis]|nr:MAG: hypothetical protein LQ337_002398 [Flavoplaca oasis]
MANTNTHSPLPLTEGALVASGVRFKRQGSLGTVKWSILTGSSDQLVRQARDRLCKAKGYFDARRINEVRRQQAAQAALDKQTADQAALEEEALKQREEVAAAELKVQQEEASNTAAQQQPLKVPR